MRTCLLSILTYLNLITKIVLDGTKIQISSIFIWKRAISTILNSMTDIIDLTLLGFKQIPPESGTLALIGGAEYTGGCSFDQYLLEKTKSKTISLIPTAAAFENPNKAVENAAKYFSQFGVEVNNIMILKRDDASNSNLIDQINKAEFLYIPGGSPLHLKGVLKDTPALDAIVNKWQSGTPLAGSSAGAMVIGDPMIDPRGGAYTVGLKLIKNLSVIPHFDSSFKERNSRSLKFAPKNTLIVGLEEKTALIRNTDGTWISMGAGNSHLYLNHEQLDLSDLN